jgi:hypothetical protein
MYIIAQNSPCDCKEPSLKNVNVEKMILKSSEYLRDEILIDGYDVLSTYFKCIAQCKDVQKEKLTNNGLTYGTKYTYNGKSVTVFSGEGEDNSSKDQTVSQQATDVVDIQRGEGESASPNNSPDTGAPNVSANNSGVNSNIKAQYERWMKMEMEKEKTDPKNTKTHEGNEGLSDLITNFSLNETQYNTTVLYDIMAQTDRVGQIANSREGELTQYDGITTIDPDLLPDKLQTTEKCEEWGLFQGNFDVIILTDHPLYQEETDENEQTEIQSEETVSSNHAHQPNAMDQQIESNETVADSMTSVTSSNANGILTHLKETIKYDKPTTIITTSGEKYDAPAGSYFTGTVKNGVIEQGTLYNENKKPLKTFFRKK